MDWDCKGGPPQNKYLSVPEGRVNSGIFDTVTSTIEGLSHDNQCKVSARPAHQTRLSKADVVHHSNKMPTECIRPIRASRESFYDPSIEEFSEAGTLFPAWNRDPSATVTRKCSATSDPESLLWTKLLNARISISAHAGGWRSGGLWRQYSRSGRASKFRLRSIFFNAEQSVSSGPRTILDVKQLSAQEHRKFCFSH